MFRASRVVDSHSKPIGMVSMALRRMSKPSAPLSKASGAFSKPARTLFKGAVVLSKAGVGVSNGLFVEVDSNLRRSRAAAYVDLAEKKESAIVVSQTWVETGKREVRASDVPAGCWLREFSPDDRECVTEDAIASSTFGRALSLVWIHDAI